MGKVAVFQIVLDSRPNGVKFWPGELIKGYVIVRLVDEIKLRSLELRAVGEAQTNWSGKRTIGNYEDSVLYQGSETLLDSKVQLIGRRNGSNEHIGIGEHRYPFEIQLPTNLPPSSEESEFSIRYKLKAKMDRPWSLDKYAEAVFTVAPFLDLNMNQFLRQPLYLTDSKRPGLFSSRSIDIKFEVNKSGFVPGEKIKFQLTIKNNTDKEAKDVSIRLVQLLKINSNGGHTKSVLRELGSKSYQNMVSSNSSIRWENEFLIPASRIVHPSFSTRIVQIEYYFECRMKAGFFSRIKTLSIPIQIGSKAITDPISTSQPRVTPFKLEQTRQTHYFGERQDENEPPPSYEETIRYNN